MYQKKTAFGVIDKIAFTSPKEEWIEENQSHLKHLFGIVNGTCQEFNTTHNRSYQEFVDYLWSITVI